jgi:ubiquinone/menaquinone biosynthesis C-methylase UbiE
MNVKAHYDQHLADFYAWMTGDFLERQTEHQQIFKSFGIFPQTNKNAIDLGAGHGIQSVALAHLGFSVTAVDFSKTLLHELNINKENLPIETVESDILGFLESTNASAELIVCMGDTLTHLNSIEDVKRLFRLCKSNLAADDLLVLSFRDLSTELIGESRFIPVRQDENRMLTCFLEYFPEHVMVHDILWEKQNNGWAQRVSAYPKLRLSERQVAAMLEAEGFSIKEKKLINRMHFVVASKNH